VEGKKTLYKVNLQNPKTIKSLEIIGIKKKVTDGMIRERLLKGKRAGPFLPFIVFILLSIVSYTLVTHISPSIEGFVTSESNIISFTDDVNIIVENSKYVNWEPQNKVKGYLSSIKISGVYEGDGDAQIYLEDKDGNRYLIANTKDFLAMKGVTAFLIKDVKKALPQKEKGGVEGETGGETPTQATRVVPLNYVCEETCNLLDKKLNYSSYKLYFELHGNGKVKIFKIQYSFVKVQEENVSAIQNMSSEKYYEKIKDDENFDVKILSTSWKNDNFVIVFSHNSTKEEPFYIIGNVTYGFSKYPAPPNENITLTIYKWDGSRFELQVGNQSEVFVFQLPKNETNMSASYFGRMYIVITPKIKDFENKDIPTTAKVFQNNKLIAISEGTPISVKKGNYTIKLIPRNHIVKSITLKNVEIQSTLNEIVDLDLDIPSNIQDAVQSFAIDPKVKFVEGNVTITPKGNFIYKCKDWNFSSRECEGSWTKIADVTPGQNYTLHISANDPAYVVSADGTCITVETNKYKVCISNNTSYTSWGYVKDFWSKEYDPNVELSQGYIADYVALVYKPLITVPISDIISNQVTPTDITILENGSYRVAVEVNWSGQIYIDWYFYNDYYVGRIKTINFAGTYNDGLRILTVVNDTNTTSGYDSYGLHYTGGSKAGPTDTTTSTSNSVYDVFDQSSNSWVSWYGSTTNDLAFGKIIKAMPSGATDQDSSTIDIETNGSDYFDQFWYSANSIQNYDDIFTITVLYDGNSNATVKNIYSLHENPATITAVENCTITGFDSKEFIYKIQRNTGKDIKFNITGNSNWDQGTEKLYIEVTNLSHANGMVYKYSNGIWTQILSATQIQFEQDGSAYRAIFPISQSRDSTTQYLFGEEGPPTTPTNISCDGGSCNRTFSNSVNITCSGSTDPDGDTITYVIEANYSDYSCYNNGSCSACSDSSSCSNCSSAGCSWGGGTSKTNIYYTGWESGPDGWTDPGSDSDWSSVTSNCQDDGSSGGSYSWHLQDDTTTSYTEKSFNFTGYTNVTISWSAYYTSIEAGECIDLKCDGNIVWTYCPNEKGTEGQWLNGCTDEQCVTITPSDCTFDDSVTIRFETEFSGNRDDAYLDCVNITGIKSVPQSCNGNLNCDTYTSQTSCQSCSQCAWGLVKKWRTIGNHTEGSTFVWNVSNIPDQTNVDLRCRAIDVDGTNTYSNYYDPLTNLTILNTQTCVVSLSTNTISFGSVNPGTNTGSTNQNVTITNSGSGTATNVTIRGTDWSDGGGNTFAVGNTEWSTSAFTYGSGTDLTTTDAAITTNLGAGNSITTYFGVGVPQYQAASSYTQTITITMNC